MDKKTLTSLFSESLFQIPDYQRGYAWEEKQHNDFIQDIDALVNENVGSHYTGTVVVYCGRDAVIRDYDRRRLKVMDVVDGQQRLTICCLYLSEIIRALIGKGEAAYERDVSDFLYSDGICKLALNNDTGGIFYDLLRFGRSNTVAQTPHGRRLIDASNRFKEHIEIQLKERQEGGITYLKELYRALTQKLNFTFYTIEEECEIGMTFELMNSRGKGLSVLELLKNYLMHWISRNEIDGAARSALTVSINKNWKDTYTNLGACSGDEDQCLRIAWTLYCNHSPANWIGYDGFKGDDYIPLRNFNADRSKADTKLFIHRFADALAEVSSHYACISSPSISNATSQNEFLWLTKIHHTGNIANFLPLMVAARKHMQGNLISEKDYISLLKSLECFAYRVFLFDGRRSNAGKSSFHRWGYEILRNPQTLPTVIASVYSLTRYYASEKSFFDALSKLSNWYGARNRLKYTLFEYEIHLLTTEGKGKSPHLAWKQLNDSTIEHILPQTPEAESHWRRVWSQDDFENCLHDIGNLVLTQNNSNYRNFEFSRKKGEPGQSPSYSNSDIRQERKIAGFSDWSLKEFQERREVLQAWISLRWKTEGVIDTQLNEITEDDDIDGLVEIGQGYTLP